MKKITLIILLFITSLNLFSTEKIDEMEFINRPIKDIAFALSKSAGVNIIPDTTIEGTTTFYFAGGTAEEALDLFLNQNQLYMIEGDNHIKLSKIRIDMTKSGLINLDAHDVQSLQLLKQLSSVTRKTILFDALPPDRLTLHVSDLPIERILEMVITKHNDYYLEVLEGYYYIRHKPQELKVREKKKLDLPEGVISGSRDKLSLNVDQESFKKLLIQFFRFTENDFIFLGQNNGIIENIYTKDKTFDETLKIILEQGDSDYTLVGKTFYIFDSQRRNIIDNYNSSILINLENITAKKLIELMPPALSSKVTIKIENEANLILLYGSMTDISRVQSFIIKMDKELGKKTYYRYDLSFLDATKIKALLPEGFKNTELIIIPDTTGIIVKLSKDQVSDFEHFLKLADVPSKTYEIKLKYIKSEDFIKALPPSISKEEIVTSQDTSIIFFKGEEEKYKQLQKELALIDKPTPQIRYDLLVIQYQENKKFNWNFDVKNSVLESGADNAFLGSIGAILNLSFDITSTFGYLFSLNLDADISQSKAKVMADSTLNALSGQQAKFRNTNTYRYRDTVKDSDTGDEEVTGVSREITSGLFIDLNGWVSGEDMITMDISTTFSKQESVSSDSDVGTLPPTSEKIIETHIRTRAGEPVVIGGLIQQELTQSIQKTPILGSIPILGYLFQSRQENSENTEMVIYIIPYIEQDKNGMTGGETRLERYKRKYSSILEDNE